VFYQSVSFLTYLHKKSVAAKFVNGITYDGTASKIARWSFTFYVGPSLAITNQYIANNGARLNFVEISAFKL
jgi:hypothetical protein